MPKELWLPIFPPGRYKSDSGNWHDLNVEKLREMYRNTDFVLKRGIITPPIAFRHPTSNRKALGHIDGVRFDNNVLAVRVAQPKFIRGTMRGDFLDFSGEFREQLEFVEDQKSRQIGPVVVGTAILGDELPGVKNALKRPLKECVEAAGLSPVDEYEFAEELRKTGLVSQTFAEDGTYCFSEIQIDPQIFTEERKPMTAEELQQITNVIKSEVAPIKADLDGVKTSITTMKTETDTKLQQFSEQAKTESKIIDTLDTIRKERKLGKIPMERLEKALREPTFDNVKAFAEVAPTAAVTLGEQHGDESGGKKEPDALKKLRISDFNEPSKHDALIHAGLQAFAEAEPTKWSVVADKPHAAKIDALKTHIAQRDASAN